MTVTAQKKTGRGGKPPGGSSFWRDLDSCAEHCFTQDPLVRPAFEDLSNSIGFDVVKEIQEGVLDDLLEEVEHGKYGKGLKILGKVLAKGSKGLNLYTGAKAVIALTFLGACADNCMSGGVP